MSKITCQICSNEVHSIQIHLRKAHPEMTTDDYTRLYPDAPLLSPEAEAAIEKKRTEMKLALAAQQSQPTPEVADNNVVSITDTKKDMHLLFGIRSQKAVFNAKGDPIPISILGSHNHSDMVPDHDPNYVFDPSLLKTALMAIELNKPAMFWGHAGTGKTTIWEQIAHHTNRPLLRVQHTANMEESDVTGRWIVRGGETIYDLGPLALAMKHGYLYLADEYDFAFPSVLSVYQPVLEGKPLIIKEADAENRVIRPHRNFRFVATGNTNGAGDETGLYQGTNLQNAANYSRFAITEQVKHMPKRLETLVVMKQANVTRDDAAMLVDFANEIRQAYEGAKIGSTIGGPRELINAAMIGSMKASWKDGIELAITNRWSKVDREIANGVAERIIGQPTSSSTDDDDDEWPM